MADTGAEAEVTPTHQKKKKKHENHSIIQQIFFQKIDFELYYIQTSSRSCQLMGPHCCSPYGELFPWELACSPRSSLRRTFLLVLYKNENTAPF